MNWKKLWVECTVRTLKTKTKYFLQGNINKRTQGNTDILVLFSPNAVENPLSTPLGYPITRDPMSFTWGDRKWHLPGHKSSMFSLHNSSPFLMEKASSQLDVDKVSYTTILTVLQGSRLLG